MISIVEGEGWGRGGGRHCKRGRKLSNARQGESGSGVDSWIRGERVGNLFNRVPTT